MATTLTTSARNAAANAVVDLLDAGSGAGYLEIIHSDGTSVLVTVTLADPAFGNAATGVATANTIAQATATGDGTATTFKAYDSDANEIFSGSVTATGGGGEIEVTNTSISTGDKLEITSATYTQPAS